MTSASLSLFSKLRSFGVGFIFGSLMEITFIKTGFYEHLIQSNAAQQAELQDYIDDILKKRREEKDIQKQASVVDD
jgi:hypothetical protein